LFSLKGAWFVCLFIPLALLLFLTISFFFFSCFSCLDFFFLF
jgi:hypothetical protein